uniref:Transposase n=1 Tax=Angiostrongylus cantonensis TaxID=6313 RepID=A0A0K0D020_ANGCA
MQARMIRYDVIGLAETRRRHLFNAVYDTGEELFPGTCDSKGIGGVGVLVNTSEHRFIRTAYNPNRTSTIEKMWINVEDVDL